MARKYKIINKKRFAAAVTAFALTFGGIGYAMHDIIIDGASQAGKFLVDGYEKEMAYNVSKAQPYLSELDENQIEKMETTFQEFNEEKSK